MRWSLSQRTGCSCTLATVLALLTACSLGLLWVCFVTQSAAEPSSVPEPHLRTYGEFARIESQRIRGATDAIAVQDQAESVTSTLTGASETEASHDRFGDQYLAVCLTIKDQHDDILEWIAHHEAQGVGKFYVYDAQSTPPLRGVLEGHIRQGLVEHIWWNSSNSAKPGVPQVKAYAECLDNFASRHQFIGFIDADEFLVLKDGSASVPDLLKRMQAFEPIGGLAVNWIVFGSSGHISRPKVGTLKAFTSCNLSPLGSNALIKSIVNTDHVVGPHSEPHSFKYKEGFYAVNERFQKVERYISAPASWSKIALHHYIVKSYEEFAEKVQRGAADGSSRKMDFFNATDAGATDQCTDAADKSV